METRYTEKRNITSRFDYEYAGHGIDANQIFNEFETKFSIARGIIQEHKFTRMVTEDGKTYTSFVR